jgi:3-phytase
MLGIGLNLKQSVIIEFPHWLANSAFFFLIIFIVVGCQFPDTTKKTKSNAACIELEAQFETQAVEIEGDVLDDPAIWVHPYSRDQSQILVTNKKGGLHVYDLKGNEIQYIPAGRLNNVDIRYDFPFIDKQADLAVASNRSFNTLSIFRINAETGKWKEVSARTISTSLPEVHGLCMYRSLHSGKFYAIVNSKQGMVEQWELFCSRDSLVDAKKVRQFSVNGQIEGCVADDETGYLYIAEERFGIWKYYAEPVAPDRRLVADTSRVLSPQIEGLALYKRSRGKGYLIASLQQKNRFAVFERQGLNRYLGCFSIVDGPKSDGVTHCDGIELTELPLGPNFQNGLLVVHDGNNTEAGKLAPQNLKLIDWALIAKSFNPPLAIDTLFNYRLLRYPKPEQE